MRKICWNYRAVIAGQKEVSRPSDVETLQLSQFGGSLPKLIVGVAVRGQVADAFVGHRQLALELLGFIAN